MSYQLAIGINLFNSPEDNTQAEFISLLEGATKCIHLADYSFNIMGVVNILIAKAKAGVEVKLVLDNSQSKGRTEVPEITALKACPEIKMVIVESSESAIMHNKSTTIDGHITETGSWNYTTAASKENNNFFVFDDNLIATDFNVTAAFDKVFNDMFTGVTTKLKYTQGV
ncbi:MAG TPA: phospholipase D-like domain-containing protein [Dongiaceae bacterium]|nr:phospholipase D-like domain-containing protein [Dongiaceae bacterium]